MNAMGPVAAEGFAWPGDENLYRICDQGKSLVAVFLDTVSRMPAPMQGNVVRVG